MANLIALVIGFALSSFLLKVFTTLGIGIFTYYGLKTLIDNALDMLEPLLSALPASILNLMAIAGVPEALSVICSALLTRAAINSAKAFVGVVT